jgi:hypothetical protein
MNGLPTFRAIWRRIRPGRRAAIFVIASFAVVLAIHGIELARARHAWTAYSGPAEARGVEFALARLIPDPQVPDAENFAAIPLIQAGLRARQGEGPQPTELDLPPGALDSLQEDGPADLQSLRRALVAAGWTTDDPAVPDAVVCGRGLARLDSSLAQMREGAKRPYARYPRNLEHPEKSAVPPFLLLRKTAQVLFLRFEVNAAAGRLDAACEDLELSLRIARGLDEAPTWMGTMIRGAITRLPVQNLQNWLHTAPWTEAQLARMASALAPHDLLRAYRRGIAVERASLTKIGQNAAEGKISPRELMEMVTGPQGRLSGWEKCQAALKRTAGHLYPRGWHLQSVRWANENCFDAADARISPERHRWDPSRSLDVEALIQRFNTFDKLRLVLACIGVPNLTRAEARMIVTQAQLDLARVAVALEQDRRARGAFPSALTDLVSATLASLPHDLTDGQPLRYRLAPDGSFVLYSLSYNRADDGGSNAHDPAAPAIGSFAQRLDWTWSSRPLAKELAIQVPPAVGE